MLKTMPNEKLTESKNIYRLVSKTETMYIT